AVGWSFRWCGWYGARWGLVPAPGVGRAALHGPGGGAADDVPLQELVEDDHGDHHHDGSCGEGSQVVGTIRGEHAVHADGEGLLRVVGEEDRADQERSEERRVGKE